MKKLFFHSLISLLLLQTVFYKISYAQAEKQSVSVANQTELETLTEQNIYIPYKIFDEVLEKKEKGIFIPYSDFLKLWEEATKKPADKVISPPPLDAAIIHAKYTGIVYDDIAEFKAELKISALKKNWASLILNIENIAITSFTIDGKTPILKPVDNGLELVLPEEGNYVLQLEFSTRVNTAPGKNFINFQIPSSPLTKIDLTIPGKDLDVKIEPMVSRKSSVAGENTLFSAFLSPDGKVNISWLAKSLESKTTKSLIFAKSSNEIYIKESVYLINTKFDFSIMQAKIDSLKVKIPSTLSLVRVDGENIKDWNLGDDGILSVNLYEKIDGNYNLSIGTEKYRDIDETMFEIPQFEVIGAQREDGEIIIKAEPSLRVQVEKKNGVTQIDPKEIGNRIDFNEFVSAFKYFRLPYTVSLNISKIKPKITAKQNILISFSETIIDYYTNVNFTIKDAGLFKFRFLIPDNFRVSEIANDNIVESFDITKEGDSTILTVVLKNKAYGDFILPIHLETDKEDKAVSNNIPKLLCLDAEKEDGIIALSLRKNLKLSTEDIKSLRPISLEELQSLGIRAIDPKNEIAAGYRYSTTDYSSILKIDKRSTKIIANVERNIDIEEAVMKINDVIRYDILYAPVSKFMIELPALIGKDAVITGDNIKEKRFSTDMESNTGIWEIELHSPILNQFVLNVSLENKLPSVTTDNKISINIPPVKVLDVFNESGVISITKSPNLQVTAEENNLEPIDSKELPSTMNKDQSVLAFRYLNHPYSLSLESTKHEYEKILDTIVNQAHFDIVVSNEGIAKTEGVFKIQNTNRQSLELMMPEGTDKIFSVFISGKKASISKGESPRSKIIMLPKDITPGQEFSLRIIYQSQLRKDFGSFGGLKAESAEIVDIPCSKITWRIYLPDEYSYIYLDGSLSQSGIRSEPFNDINPYMQSQQVRSQQKIQLNNKQIPQQSDEQALYGLDIEIIREGRMYSFSKLDKQAYLNVWYVKKLAIFPISLIIIALATIMFTLIQNKYPADKIKFISITLASALALFILLPQGFKFFIILLITGFVISKVPLANNFINNRLKYTKSKSKKPINPTENSMEN
ncbi:MAG: hypothetical protein A2267_01420 [Omnitrophica WOR_2 bacterium RIFOXYA12_FULL_38_10]|nr:MAG: hypothetical protein A2267_01420 [Omnitrophica WOR_2 bacterium RIFOXYA12_FULL_38_10]OGX58684.1 MAG: hypothetical protein A2447_05170 [Omnitrophica WOR_2 bacterium RIFOXYC2_FULL_38_12]